MDGGTQLSSPAVADKIALGICRASGKSRILKLQRLEVCSKATAPMVCPPSRGALRDVLFPPSLSLLMQQEMKGTVCVDLL